MIRQCRFLFLLLLLLRSICTRCLLEPGDGVAAPRARVLPPSSLINLASHGALPWLSFASGGFSAGTLFAVIFTPSDLILFRANDSPTKLPRPPPLAPRHGSVTWLMAAVARPSWSSAAASPPLATRPTWQNFGLRWGAQLAKQ